jgi:hypothetical protein
MKPEGSIKLFSILHPLEQLQYNIINKNATEKYSKVTNLHKMERNRMMLFVTQHY